MEPELPLVGMASERQRVGAAFDNREPLLILGPRGCGKTRLIGETLRGRQEWLYIAWEPTLHALLVSISRALIGTGHSDFLARATPGAEPEGWLSRQTSIHLKGLLWNSLESAPAPLVLDGICGAGFPAYRFLRRIYHTTGMTIVAAARDTAGMGALNRLLWDPERMLRIAPLNVRDAADLFDSAADLLNLGNLSLNGFREKVLECANGNPGQIIEKCRLATQPQYLAGRHVKFAPLRIDAFIKSTG